MDSARIILVMLRRPNGADPQESRTDPLWEFGSFGCTGCHRRNLMNPRRIGEVAGARLAFAQGGPLGVRLVLLTPSVKAVEHPHGAELRWRPVMPFRYEHAPILACNDAAGEFGAGDFRDLKRLLSRINRPTPVAQFASRFRTCRTPVPPGVGEEIVRRYQARRKVARRRDIASTYEQALPMPPPVIDRARRATYNGLLAQLGSRPARSASCRPRQPKQSCGSRARPRRCGQPKRPRRGC